MRTYINMESTGEHLDGATDIVVARHLADRLNDHKSLAYYHIVAQRYSHKFLLDLLASILQVPDEKITTSRAAIFVANIKRYEPTR
jgi:hypothetical protein